jgi:hypothetical protein
LFIYLVKYSRYIFPSCFILHYTKTAKYRQPPTYQPT